MKKKQFTKAATLLLCAGLVFTTQAALAQGGGASGGAAGINEATSQITAYFDPMTRLMYAIGAVLAVIGGVQVYSKWNSGAQDTQKAAVQWFGSMIFLVVVAAVIRSFFL